MSLLLALLLQDAWPQFRGPSGDGLSAGAQPPIEWSETKNLRWKVEIPGSGSATPIVWGKKVFVLTAVETGKGKTLAFDVLCLDLDDGTTLWRKAAVEAPPHAGRHDTNTFASASPSTDGRRLLVPFGSRGIFMYDVEGALAWSKDLGDMRIKINFGEGASPVLSGDAVVVPWDHEGESFIACLDAATGEERWRTPRDEGTTWTTPLVVDGQVVMNGQKRTRSYDLKTGRVIWECGGQAMNPIAVPIARDGIVYCMTGYKGHAVVAIRLDSKGEAAPVWKRSDTGPYVASGLLYGDLLYVTKEREGVLSCLNAKTGEPVFGPERLPGVDTLYASLAGAADRIYVAGRDGVTLVLKRGPKLEILASNTLSEGVDASPVLVGSRLLLRGSKHLYCVERK